MDSNTIQLVLSLIGLLLTGSVALGGAMRYLSEKIEKSEEGWRTALGMNKDDNSKSHERFNSQINDLRLEIDKKITEIHRQLERAQEKDSEKRAKLHARIDTALKDK
jgi:Fe2+ transport system protein B